jgi:pimeloyl-ACP methyl ester carboxylesterase
MSTRTRTTYVLVHGSWHGGWCWQKLLPFLRQENLTVYTPTLTGLGERSHLVTPTTGLSLHIQDIVNVLEFEDLHGVVLVGHSYTGMVITGVAEYSDRVGKLVYLDAIVAEDGESMFSLFSGMEADFKHSADTQGLIPPWAPEEYGVTDPQDVAWMTPRLTPMPLLTHAEKLHAPTMKAKTLPSSFIHCTQFGLGAFGEKIRREGGTVFPLNTGHDAMITQPQALADILVQHAW